LSAEQATLRAGSEMPAAIADFRDLLARPAAAAQLARLQERGINTEGDFERSLGRRVLETLPDL